MERTNADTASAWDGVWKDSEFQTTYNEIFEHFDVGLKMKYMRGKILEAGSGNGHFVKFFNDIGGGRECWGIDLSPKGVEMSNKNVGADKIILGDVKAMPFADRFFDSVISLGVIEHDKHPELLVNEMARVLKKGGVLYCTVPKRYHWWIIQKTYLSWLGKFSPGYAQSYSKARLRKVLEAGGFKIIRYIPKSDLSTYMFGFVAEKK